MWASSLTLICKFFVNTVESVACNGVRYEVVLVGDYEDQCYVGCGTVLITREVPVAVLLNLLSPASFCLTIHGVTSDDQMNDVSTHNM